MGDFRVRGATRIYVILFCTIVKAVFSTGLGKCPLYPSLPNFDIKRMEGTWYEVERSFYLMEISASCTELEVILNERGYLLITVNTINRWTGSPSTTYGIGIPNHNGSSTFRYKLNNRMPYIIGQLLPGAGLYNILFTDYDQFAIVWSCNSVSFAHSDRMWILGRSREIEASVRAHIYAIMEELKLDSDRLVISKNNNCTATEYITNHIRAIN
ncbi:apolipoprotein D-like [Hyposmocoma kahamanoa]|uniref:apolipoprotein D-like n=1 Tax=Hyposmocoma kahamanoa TaxID=1477025 RepID=UPI000E6D6B6D|nr:apolipoprotein D-like [Hyposmocoma kahamanoa]XP_026329449.1 apolipoprotein D-like [Hyposmocoma kahamanoa]